MGKGFKVKSNPVYPSSPLVKSVSVKDANCLSFRFDFLRECKKKFCFSSYPKEYFQILLKQLGNISRLTRSEMSTAYAEYYRHHPIDFTKANVSENSFNGIPSEVYSGEAWQFNITSNKWGRVHGFYIGNVFHIVWLDKEHDLYPGEK